MTNKKTILKSLRFSEDEYLKIEDQLKNENLKFSYFARTLLLNHKIKFPSRLELLFKLSIIQNLIEHLSNQNDYSDNIDILVELIKIERSLEILAHAS